VNTRESVRITRADRTPTSLAFYAGEAKTRAEYLIEEKAAAHFGLMPQFRAAMASYTPGKKIFTNEQLTKMRAEEDAKKLLAK
jgi:hypothetical protein